MKRGSDLTLGGGAPAKTPSLVLLILKPTGFCLPMCSCLTSFLVSLCALFVSVFVVCYVHSSSGCFLVVNTLVKSPDVVRSEPPPVGFFYTNRQAGVFIYPGPCRACICPGRQYTAWSHSLISSLGFYRCVSVFLAVLGSQLINTCSFHNVLCVLFFCCI